MNKVWVTCLLALMSCSSQKKEIKEAEVINTIEGFFAALNVNNNDPDLMSRYVTDDFIIYEAGQKMSKQKFNDFVSWPDNMKQTTWELSDFRISIEGNTAHASLLNDGTFTSETDSLQFARKIQWLESAYLVTVNDSLKIKFYFSDRVKASTDTTAIN